MPFALVAADVDGDGFPDLATADYRSDTVSVLRNVSVPPGGVRAEYNLEPNETLSTGSDATSTDPMATMITSPVATTITIVESPVVTTPVPDGFLLLDTQVAIHSDVPATFDNPFAVVFRLDPTLLGGAVPADLRAVRNGVPVELCTGAPDAIPDPCHDGAPLVDPSTGDVVVTILTSDFSIWNFALVVADDGDFLFSVESGETLAGGLRVNNEDVVRYDASEGDFELVFDGSDVGVSDLAIDALALLPDGDLVLSFRPSTTLLSSLLGTKVKVPGVTGKVEDSDLVRFTPTSLGDDTRGKFSLFFDGSDIGLTDAAEGIDAVEIVGHDIYLSTSGSFKVDGGAQGPRRGPARLPGGRNRRQYRLRRPRGGLRRVRRRPRRHRGGTRRLLLRRGHRPGPVLLHRRGASTPAGRTATTEDVFACAGDLDTCEGHPAYEVVFAGDEHGLGRNDVVAIETGLLPLEN